MPTRPAHVWLELPCLPPVAPGVVVWLDLQGRVWLSFPALVYAWLCVAGEDDARQMELWEVA